MTDGVLDLPPLEPAAGRRMEQTIAAVRSAVDDGRMTPGVKYSVYQLAEALGISRTPVREALLQLEQVGLIRFEQRQGFRILLPDPKEIADIFAVRLSLEIPAVRRVAAQPTPGLCKRLDDEMAALRAAAHSGDESLFAHHDQLLHDAVLEAADNARARAIISSLRETTRLLGASTADRTRSLFDIDAEHRPIVSAIVDRDAPRAEAALRDHLVSTGRLLVAQAVRDQQADADPDSIWFCATAHLLG
ncbi:GntR family transcriptional regulator [Nocardia sp. KC 131]|uniref:GntR family transcriptional regulator n=1 Tax=Nocardia arseniciresistens TaxID=3392119 RepID=UPI00398E7094